MAKTATKKELVASIKDMNKVLNPDPLLDLDDDMDLDDLIVSFKEGAEMVQPEDKLAKSTIATAKKLGVEFGDGEEPEEKKEEKVEKPKKDKKTPAKKDTKKTDKKTPAAKKERTVDAYGFRPGCKKSLVMDAIKKGKSTMEDLRSEFGGQVKWAIEEALERTGTKVKELKNGKVQLDK